MSRMPGNLDSSQSSNDGIFSMAAIKRKSHELNQLTYSAIEWYRSRSTVKRLAIGAAAILGIAAGLVVLIFHSYFLGLLVALSNKWEKLSYAWPLLFVLVFIVGFPPLIGFSALSMLTGMVFGYAKGWFLLASASISGSLCSFLLFRYILQNQAKALVQRNEMFRALADVFNEKSSLFLLVLIRLCPLPYSLSNGALAAIPRIPITNFLLASVFTSPKLLIHIFVGSKIKELGDTTKTKSTKILDLVGIAITGLAVSATTYIIYEKMKKKLESYRSQSQLSEDRYDRMIFGDFDDSIDSSNNIELNSDDFDADNFIIDDEDVALETYNQEE